MKTILVTGVTGFLGSSLVANLLKAGLRVKALSRRDPQGARTREAIETAARGFGFALDSEQRAGLCVEEVDFNDLEGSLDPRVLADVTEVWNVAAEMSYSTRKVLQAVDQNVMASCRLYSLVARHARQCQRFYHVSTAYVAGIDCLDAREQLHATPKLLNSYQLSKWMAEFHLIQHQRDLGLPLTLFRPSIIIGHQETGWSSGAPFGMFSLIELVLGARRLRADHLQIAVRAEAQPDLVCVDTVVERAQALLNAREHREPVEIFHCVADTRLPMIEALRPASTQLGVSLGFGPLKSAVDVELDRLFEGNKPFANKTWTFHSERLQRVLGSAYVPRPISPDIVRRSTNHYLTQSLRLVALEHPVSPLSVLSARLSPGPGLVGNAPGSLGVSPP